MRSESKRAFPIEGTFVVPAPGVELPPVDDQLPIDVDEEDVALLDFLTWTEREAMWRSMGCCR